MFTVNKNPTTQDLRTFGVAMLVGFGAVGSIVWLLHAHQATIGLAAWDASAAQIAAAALWAVGALCFVLSRASPATLKPIYVAWMSATVPLGLLMSTVLLTLLFVVVLPIFSLIVRLGDPLRKKLTASGGYWEDYRRHEPTIERMRRPF